MISQTLSLRELDAELALAPERYDPRRMLSNDGVPLGQLVTSVREVVNPAKHDEVDVLVLDTGDADRGLIIPHNAVVTVSRIRSLKKVVQAGDVVISRLRSYLRQVALIDEFLVEQAPLILCSTEFFVLRSRDGGDVSFLVPWLLSDQVQRALSAGQEGGHHPRFGEDQLLNLRVPEIVLDQRTALGDTVRVRTRGALEASREILELADRLSD